MISNQKIDEIKRLYDKGITKEKIAEQFSVTVETINRYLRLAKPPANKPAIFLLDIETSPIHVRAWGLYKQRIDHFRIIHDWFMISWAGKWLGASNILSDVVTPEEAKQRDDKRIAMSIWEHIDRADIIMAHNCKKFDNRKLNARFIMHGILPPSPYQQIDTLKASQKEFAFSSHKLDYLTTMFSLRKRIQNYQQLWVDCEAGKQEALDYMLFYNESDINALEDLYLRIRPYIKSHPNLGVMIGKDHA